MTRLSVDQEAVLAELAGVWIDYKAERKGAELRIRARVLAEVAESVATARRKVTAAIGVALDAGVPRIRLKEVTTKDRLSFDALLPARADPAEAEVSDDLGDSFECSWEDGLVRLVVHPSPTATGKWSLSEPTLWSVLLEAWARPSDGKLFLDPPVGTRDWPNGEAALEWQRATPANVAKLSEWLESNPRLHADQQRHC